MNMPFSRRRDISDFADAIRPELKSLPAPEPSKELLPRILASREAGARIILPDVPSEPSRTRFKVVGVGAAIAAAMLLSVIPRERSHDGSSDDAWASPIFLGNAAFAQTTSRAPLFPPISVTRAGMLRPMSVQLARRYLDRNGKLTMEHRSDVSLSPAVVNNKPAWKITSLERDVFAKPISIAETLYVARSDLRMLSRAVHVSPYRRFERINIQQRFLGDSVSGRMTTDGPSIGAGRVIARKLDPEFGPYLSDAFAPMFLMAAPLHRDWRGSASLLGWSVIPNDVFAPLSMRVEGEERIKVPAGTFDCWRVVMEIAGKRITFWARKSDGLGVRVYDASDASTGGPREVLLLSVR